MPLQHPKVEDAKAGPPKPAGKKPGNGKGMALNLGPSADDAEFEAFMGEGR
jgi:hypothetical protein